MTRMVYFVRPVGADGPIKIGCTSYPRQRLTQLMQWSPVDLEILATVPGGFNLEARIHRQFISQHLRQEWFAPSAELAALIESVASGTFDEQELPADARPLWHERHRARRWPNVAAQAEAA